MAADPEYEKHQRDLQRAWYETSRLKHPIRNLLNGARSRARQKGIEFDIDPSDLTMPTHCPVLGTHFDLMDKGIFSPHIPSLDRIDPRLGYIRGNVKIISLRANILKSNCIDPAELRAVADYIEESLPQVQFLHRKKGARNPKKPKGATVHVSVKIVNKA